MTSFELNYSTGIFVIASIICVAAFIYTYGGRIIKDRFAPSPSFPLNKVTSNQVANYFREMGYIVCHSTQVINTDKWVAFLIKDGSYHIVTVFTDGDTILGHDYSLV